MRTHLRERLHTHLHTQRQAQRRFQAIILGVAALTAIGCSDLSTPKFPPGTQDPKTYHTKEGALGMRVAALDQFASSIPEYILYSGLMTDELQSREAGVSSSDPRRIAGVYVLLDSRDFSEDNLQNGAA